MPSILKGHDTSGKDDSDTSDIPTYGKEGERMEFYFKKKKRFKVLCFLIVFALLLQISMPAFGSVTMNTGAVQTKQSGDTANTTTASGSTSASDSTPASGSASTSDNTPVSDNTTASYSSATTLENTAASSGCADTSDYTTDPNGKKASDQALGTSTCLDKTATNTNAALQKLFQTPALSENAESPAEILTSDSGTAGDDANTATAVAANRQALVELTDLREANVKYFENTDGTKTAYVYDHDVHYLDGNGNYQDIDNSLKKTQTSTGKDVLTNEDNSADFTLAQDASDGNTVSIHKDGYNLKWRLVSSDDSQAQDTTVETNGLQNMMAAADDPTNVSDTVSSAEYSDILKNVDLQYVMLGSELKENITLSNAKVPSQFSFLLTTSGDLFAKEWEGGIYFENTDGDTVFHMSEALMYDAKGAESNEIQVQLAVVSETDQSHEYKLTVTPSASWLKDDSRVYPVVLDPTISTTQSSSAISDAHVNSESPTTNYGTSTSVVVGTNSSGSSRAYLKFTLPTEIQKSDRILSASLGLYTNTTNSYSIFSGSQISAAPTMYMFAPSADWSASTLTWSNQPSCDSLKTIDYSKIDIVNGAAKTGWYTWDVTSLVDNWYNGGANYGVMIKDTESTQYAKRAYFYSSNLTDSSSVYPMISISYVNTIGLEDYWTYHTQSAGLAGTGYVNDFTGALTTTFDDYAWDSEILSLAVSHIYNSYNGDSTEPSLDVGKGFMLSLQESITPVTINGTSLYRYVDGDGTEHYFQLSDSKWTDDSGLGLTLSINTNDYTITDKEDNLRVFDKTTGYLQKIQDNDGNKITLTYSSDGKYLGAAADDAGHLLTFNYDSIHRLQWISVKQSSDPNTALEKISYTYDSTGHLIQVTFPGKSNVDASGGSGADNIAQFGYTAAGSLNSLIDTTNGMHVDYTYADWWNSNQTRRIAGFTVYNTAGSVDSAYSMAYTSHCTRFTETTPNISRSQVYVFNYMGQTISAQDQDDNALYCETGLSGGAKNKVTFASKAQQSVTNLLKNHDFENGMTSFGTIGNGTFSIDTSHAFYGNKCVKITTTAASPNISSVLQGAAAPGGKVYTLSSYIKTVGCSTNGANLRLVALDGSNLVAAGDVDKIVSENGYLRFDTSLDLTAYSSSKTYTLYVYIGLKNVAATAYFDSVQLEAGACANRYNLIEDGNFEDSTNAPWTGDGTTSSDLLVSGSNVTRDGKGSCYQFKGDATVSKKLYQDISVSGQAGDSYVFGCWVKSTGLVNKDTGDGTKQCLGMTLRFTNADGTYSYTNALITPTSDEWQYICASAVAPSNYTAVRVYVKFVFNRNNAWFDDVQVYKDSFGDSFTYDSNGNVISVVDKAKNTASAAVNGNNDTTSYTDGKGQTYAFEYDNTDTTTKHHNLTLSKAPDGIRTVFTYDSHGNVTQTGLYSNAGGSDRIISNSVSYTGNGAYKTSSTDQRNLTTTYNYDQVYGILKSTAIPVGPVDQTNMLTTTNTYDKDTRKVTSISTSFLDTLLNYSYVQNRPGSIQIGNAAAYLKYNYAYDSSGNLTSVSRSSSGNTAPTTLESYTYLAGRGLKSSQTYANGENLYYSYDNQDRLVGITGKDSAGGSTSKISQYIYDGNGLLGKSISYGEDQNNPTVTTNQYDLAERLISSMNSNGSGIYNVSYDKNNLDTGYVSYLRDGSANLEYKSAYSYNECLNSTIQNGVDKSKNTSIYVGDALQTQTQRNYDNLARLSWFQSYSDASVIPVKVGYAYIDVGTDKTTTLPSHMAIRYTSTSGSGENADKTYNLSYDSAGNVTDISTVLKDGSGYDESYGYDALSRLISAANVANSGDNYAYTYDGRNNITGSTVTNNGVTTEIKSYTYATDDIDCLASFSHTTASGTVTRNYTCDSVGNPTAITETDSADHSNRTLNLTWTQGKLLSTISDGSALNNKYDYDADGNVSKKVLADNSYVVYHYSDGSLEYEEHFNAASTLQEVLKYFYDSNGNVEYLLYKDGDFSNANAYDLYYYVRNAVGNITDLFQVRAASGSSTAAVNRLAAHYEYDPYGSILSVTKYNNDPIGDINPILYKDYYYDQQTGWYQLDSRFYDPETGRFLNADDLSLISQTDSNVVDKNLYAYCDGNPVMRKDDGGQCWQIIAAIGGAVIGGGFEIGYEMIVEHKSISHLNGLAIAGAALNGAATAAFGPLGGSVASAAITAATDLLTTKKSEWRYSAGSVIAKAGADAVVSGGLNYLCGGGISASKRLASKVSESGIKSGIKAYRAGEKAILKNVIKVKGLKHIFASRWGWGTYSTQKYYTYFSAKHYLWH